MFVPQKSKPLKWGVNKAVERGEMLSQIRAQRCRGRHRERERERKAERKKVKETLIFFVYLSLRGPLIAFRRICRSAADQSSSDHRTEADVEGDHELRVVEPNWPGRRQPSLSRLPVENTVHSWSGGRQHKEQSRQQCDLL